MATSTIFNFNFNNSEIVDSTGQWYNATTGTPTTEFIEHDGNTALLQRAYIAETSYLRNINPVFFQSRDPTFTAHTYTIELQIYPLRDSGGYGPWDGSVLDFNPTESDERGWVKLKTGQHGSSSNTFYWREYGLGPDGSGIPFLTVTTADGTYNRWYSIRIERVDDGTNTGATIKIYVDGTLVVNETLTYQQDARRGRIGNSIRYTYRRSSIDPQGAGVAIDNFKLTAGIAPSSVVDVSLANLQRNNANLLSFIKGKVPTVNDGTLTIKVNGATAGTFTANQSTAATANITVPTAVSELTNDSGYLTSSSNLDASKLTSGTVDIARLPQGALERLVKVANEAARYALTTADVQLGDTVQQLDTGIMYVVTDTDHLDSAAGYTEYTAGTAASVPWSGVTGKPTFAAVATSGAYSDLTGTPTIPTVNDATLTIQQNGTNVQTFTANQATAATANIQCVDLTNNQTVAGNKEFTGTTTAHDLVPSATDTYNFGSSSYQWNNAYIKSLTINGVACGDILTHNVSEFVNVSTAQSVDGQKIFMHSATGLGRDSYHFATIPYGKNTPPANASYQYVWFGGNTASQGFANSWYGGYLEQRIYTDGSAQGRWLIRDTSESNLGIELFVKDSDKQFRPQASNSIDLGTSTNKWKSFNGINPGALSLPGANYINLDTTGFDLTSTTIGSFTPTVDGWAALAISQKNKHFGIWIIGGTYRASFHSVINNDDYFIFALMPVKANVSMTIYCTANDIDSTRKIDWLRLFPCQGNV